MKKAKRRDEEISYWLSFSDIMAGLLIVFMLVTVFMILDLNVASDEMKVAEEEYIELKGKSEILQRELEETKIDLENIVAINDEIITLLKSSLGDSLEIDEDTGAIRLKSDLLFNSSESKLNDSGKKFIRENLPEFFEIIFSNEIKPHISSVIICGFTDDVGDYEYNLELSQDRAREVYTFILNDPVFTDFKNDFKEYIVLSGIAQADFIEKSEDETLEQWRLHNRRVEIQFELNFRQLFESLEKKLMEEDI
jgi:chemotaxis protein MotB